VTLREIKIIFQPMHEELSHFPKSRFFQKKGRGGGQRKKRREKQREEKGERRRGMSCSHTLSHLALSHVLISHQTRGIAAPISKHRLCAREGGCPLPSAALRVARALPACFSSRMALPHQLPNYLVRLIKEGMSSVLDVEDASVTLVCWRGDIHELGVMQHAVSFWFHVQPC
jgi:hypothetical protein